MTNTTGTAWEFGTPNYTNASVNITSGNTGTNCWGTLLDGSFVVNTTTSLRSPTIDLTGVTEGTLEFFDYRDMEGLFNSAVTDYGRVNILDPADLNGTPLASNLVGNYQESAGNFILNGTFVGWERWRVELPAAALNTPIVIEFKFHSDVFNPTPQGGLYIDDVTIR